MSSIGLPRELKLLSLAAGTENDAEIERVIAEGVNWEAAFRAAERENAFPVFWRRVEPFARAIPTALAEQMQRRSMVADFTLRYQERLLEQSLTSLSQIGIEVMLLKGAALASTVYGSFTRRPMGDVDILARDDDAQRAWDRLLERDWEWHRDFGLEDFYSGHQHLPPLYDRAHAGASLEIHTEPLSPNHPFGNLAELFWSERRPTQVGRASTWTPCAEHLLLHACLHFAWSNGLESAGWNCLRDVNALARSGQLDWTTFAQVARRTRSSTCAYWTLRLSKELVDGPIPAAVLSALAPERSTTALGFLERHFVAGLFDEGHACPSTRLKRRLWEAAIEPKRSGHLRSRPWARNKDFTPAGEFFRAPTSGRHGRQPHAWRDYLQALTRGIRGA